MLEFLAQLYTYVIVDTTSTLNDLTLATFDVCDLIVLITTQDIPAIKNSRLFLDLLSNLGLQRDRLMVIMKRFDKRVKNITPERVADNLKQEVVLVIPADDLTAISSVNRGVPFVLDNKNQPLARGVFALADAVRNRVSQDSDGE